MVSIWAMETKKTRTKKVHWSSVTDLPSGPLLSHPHFGPMTAFLANSNYDTLSAYFSYIYAYISWFIYNNCIKSRAIIRKKVTISQLRCFSVLSSIFLIYINNTKKITFNKPACIIEIMAAKSSFSVFLIKICLSCLTEAIFETYIHWSDQQVDSNKTDYRIF